MVAYLLKKRAEKWKAEYRRTTRLDGPFQTPSMRLVIVEVHERSGAFRRAEQTTKVYFQCATLFKCHSQKCPRHEKRVYLHSENERKTKRWIIMGMCFPTIVFLSG